MMFRNAYPLIWILSVAAANAQQSVFCPSVPTNVGCSTIVEEVKCGPSKCLYTNMCEANAAGFVPSQCSPAACPEPAADISCDASENPVTCGDLSCIYSNACLANAAGFAETTQCVGENDPTPWCPDVPSGVACGAIDDPVKCGPTNCVYSNYCNANAAGFVPNDCRSVSCPDPVGNCVANYDPIRCGEKGCIYANDCEASSAGWDVLLYAGQCTRPQPLTVTSANSPSCPSPGESIACPAIEEPVKCGPLACEYANECVANAAGFVPDQCYSTECPIPDEGIPCDLSEDPVECGPLNCLYANACIANATGFDPETECVSDPWCPVVPDGIACTTEVDEVKCGPAACEYVNPCSANAAGFVPSDCVSSSCPVPDEGTPCTLEFDPIYCGEKLCVYANDCVAEAAGFNVLPNAGECTRPTPASTSDSEPEGDEESASESSTLLVSLSAIAWIGAVVAMLVLI